MPQLQEFVRKFNEAFVTQDIDFIIDSVSEDVIWTMIGEVPIHGKNEVKKALETYKSDRTPELTISKVITHGRTAAVEGTMKIIDDTGKSKTYAFCDTYVLNKFKNGKIKELNSYVIEIKNEE